MSSGVFPSQNKKKRGPPDPQKISYRAEKPVPSGKKGQVRLDSMDSAGEDRDQTGVFRRGPREQSPERAPYQNQRKNKSQTSDLNRKGLFWCLGEQTRQRLGNKSRGEESHGSRGGPSHIQTKKTTK